MGILMFSELIAENQEQFTEPFELKDTNIVIDGLDLVRFLYKSSSQEFMNVQFGGNYVSFGAIVLAFFRNLKANNVQPYVILHGATHSQSFAQKWVRGENRHQSLEETVKYSKVFHEANDSTDNYFVDLLPYLTLETLRNVLTELNIPCIRVVFGGGATIAKVADEVKGPVLSFNSDCYLFDLKYGFVDFHAVYCDVDDIKEDDIVHCKLYRRSRLINMFNLKPEVLPFFASIFDTNYQRWSNHRNDEVFNVIKRLNVGQEETSLTNRNMRKCRMRQLLTWLKGKTLLKAEREFSQELQDIVLSKAIKEALNWNIGYYNQVDALDCALDHLCGIKCTKNHDQIVIDSERQRHFMQNKMAVEFIENNWLDEVIELKLTRNIWPTFEIDDHGKKSPTNLTVQMLYDLISLTREPRERDKSRITIHDFRDRKWPDTINHEIILQDTSEDSPVLNYDSIFLLDREKRSRLALATLKSSWTKFDKLTRELGMTSEIDSDSANELALIALVLRHMRNLLSQIESTKFQCFALSAIHSVVHHMRQEVDPGLSLVRKDMSSKQRLDAVYLLNIFQRIVKLFGQICLTLKCSLPTIKPEKCLNCVYITNMYFDYVQSRHFSDMDSAMMAAMK
ncbi:Protein asteroid -like protein 1 [Halotydeus destructor]|nr:Protein asteroid -like protein 1 [Halotydeus destructor]